MPRITIDGRDVDVPQGSTVLDAARTAVDVNIYRLRLHPLRGNRKGEWSVRISANWRVTFRFDGEDVTDAALHQASRSASFVRFRSWRRIITRSAQGKSEASSRPMGPVGRSPSNFTTRRQRSGPLASIR